MQRSSGSACKLQTASVRARRGVAWPVSRVGVDDREARAFVGGSLLVGATAVAVWLAGGVRLDEIARYVGYEVAFVFIPGWLVYAALVPQPNGRLNRIVFSWTLGYLVELLAFYVTAASGGRNAFYVYPVVVGLPALLIARHRRQSLPEPAREPVRPRSIWIVAIACSLVLVYAGAIAFTQNPLPRDAGPVTYQEDTVFVISLAADALHHWPMTEPTVVGNPLHYHLFTFMHLAAIAEVTGIDLSVVVMRLYEIPLLLLFALQLFLAGKRLGRSISAGLVAIGVVYFLGELDISTSTELKQFLFRGFFFYWLLASHSFLFGLVFFLPAMILLSDLLGRGAGRERGRYVQWFLFLVLVIGCTGAKSYSPIVVVGALVLFLLWGILRNRTVSRSALAALAIVGGVYAVANVLVFAWNSAGAHRKPFRGLTTMPGVEELNTYFGHVWGTSRVPEILAVPFGFVGLLGVTVVGIGLVLRYRGLDLSEAEAFFLSLFVAVMPTLLLFTSPGFGQLFLVFFGVIPGMVLASQGYRLYWLSPDRPPARAVLPVLVAAAGSVLVLDLLLSSSVRVGLTLALFWTLLATVVALLVGMVSRRWALPAGVAVAALGVLLAGTPAVRLLRSAAGMSALFPVNSAAGAVALGLGVAAVVVGAAWIMRHRSTAPAVVGAAVAATLLLAVLDTPLDWFPKLIGDAAAGRPLYNQEFAGLTPGLFTGLRWVRDNTKTSDVFVVNNHSIHPDGRDSKYFYYSAFAERRFVLESWDYTQATTNRGAFSLPADESPFPHRLKLTNDVFRHADPIAMRALQRQYGAKYLVVDKIHGFASPFLASRAALVYSNGDIDVYELGKGPKESATCMSEQDAGVSAVFGHGRTVDAAGAIRQQAARQGYQGLLIERWACRDFAVVLPGLSSLSQARRLQRDAAAVNLQVTVACRTFAARGGLNAVFGHRRSKAAAQRLAARAEAVGFTGLDVQQDRCGDWEVDLAGLETAAQRREFQREARGAGFNVRFEPG